MSFLSRVSRLVRANVNDLLDDGSTDLTDLRKQYRQHLKDIKTQRRKIENSVEQLDRQIDSVRSEIERLEGKAVDAAESGRVERARQHLEDKSAALVRLDELTAERREARTHLKDLASIHDALELKLERLTRKRRDDPRSAPASGDSDVFDTTGFEQTFRRMRDQIDSFDAQVEAERQLGDAEGDRRGGSGRSQRPPGSGSKHSERTETERDDLSDLKQMFEE